MRNDIYYLSDKTTVHVYEGMKNVGIYDKETGVPKFVDPVRIVMNLDEEWARNRNKTIVSKVSELRAILYYNGTKLKPERVYELEGEIESLLEERDEITYKYGLAGKEFERLYLEKQHRPEEPKDYSHKPNYNEARFRNITIEMEKLYSRKNADYGDAFTESLDEDGLLVSKIRIKDKLNRFSQLISNDALVNDESMRDTLIDLANYTVMTLMWLDENE